MKKFQLLLIIASISFSYITTFAQENHSVAPGHLNCGQHEATEEFFQMYPEQRQIAESARKQLEAETQAFSTSKDTEDDLLIIPVVFHVVHQGGDENISDEQIHSAIDALNEDFSANNSDIGDVVDEFVDIVGDVQLEFRLAKIDPNGNCTNGINRVFSETTNDGSLSQGIHSAVGVWDRSSYLNIITCQAIGEGGPGGTILGYTLIPASVNGFAGAAVDAIVMTYDNVGSIGESTSEGRHVLSHEVGHWANLQHTWGVGQVGSSSNCGDDDGVSDTPNTAGSQSFCNLENVTCGSLDNVQNFMDYTFCFRMFTEGQVNRMRAAMNSSIASRNQLYTSANLAETGVLAPEEICFADFELNKYPKICAGQEVAFEDISYNGVENWEWTFEGGTPATSTDSNPLVVYETEGTYSVSLTVSNAQGEQTVIKEDLILVVGEADEVAPFEEGFENMSELEENDRWIDVNPDNSDIGWELISQASFSGENSIVARGRSNDDNQTEILESPIFDISQLEDVVLSFKYAHARRSPTSADRLRVFISGNCGENWVLRANLNISNLPTVNGFVQGQFIPGSEDDWDEVIINTISSSFFTDQFRVKFEFTNFQGNNIFIDDINLYDPNTLSVNNNDFIRDLTLFPNPASNQVSLRMNLSKNQNGRIDLIDPSGRVIQSPFNGILTEGSQNVQIELDQSLPRGIYFVRLLSEDGIAVRKLVIN